MERNSDSYKSSPFFCQLHSGAAVLVLVLEGIWGLLGIFLACMIAPGASVSLGMAYVKTGMAAQ